MSCIVLARLWKSFAHEEEQDRFVALWSADEKLLLSAVVQFGWQRLQMALKQNFACHE